MTQQEALKRLLDKDAIRDCIMRYARGVDRRDRALLEGVYWPDAIDNHLTFEGPVADFIEFSFKYAAHMRTHHMLGNVLIEFVSSTEAHAETYYIAAHEHMTAQGLEAFTIAGRYLDRVTKRAGDWRIIERTLTCDLFSKGPSTADWDNTPFARPDRVGGRKPNDPLYRVFVKS